MKYIVPVVIFLLALPLVIIGTVFFMRRRQAYVPKPAQGNAPAFTQIPGTVAAIGGDAVKTAKAASDTFTGLADIVKKYIPDDSDYQPEDSLPATTPAYEWGNDMPPPDSDVAPMLDVSYA